MSHRSLWPTNKFVRNLLRQQSIDEFKTKNIQGKVASLKDTVYKHTMDIRAYTACSIPPHLEYFLLSDDNAQSVDLSAIMFRLHRAIGGAWAEYMHTDEELHQMATQWSNKSSAKSHRTCPFCKNGTGTPRHYVML